MAFDEQSRREYERQRDLHDEIERQKRAEQERKAKQDRMYNDARKGMGTENTGCLLLLLVMAGGLIATSYGIYQVFC